MYSYFRYRRDVNMNVLVLCPLIFSCFGVSSVSSSFTKDVTATMNAAALFHLPSETECAPYRLLDSRNNLLVTIHNDGRYEVSDRYLSRGTAQHFNQSLVFALHHVTPTDNGALALELLPYSRSADRPECTGYYFLTVSSSIGEGFWENWGPWSACSVTCERGMRIRHRNCTQQNSCFTGRARERQGCAVEESCSTPEPGYWENWGPWSACSVTCERGLRIRYRNCTLQNNCFTGQASERQACAMEASCGTSVYPKSVPSRTDWSGWSQWGDCSDTCSRGIRQRRRVCLDSDRRPSRGCYGNQTQFDVCYLNDCPSREKDKMAVGSGPDRSAASIPETVSLPLSVIVGTAAGVVMLVLVVVIGVLLVRLRKRNRRDRRTDSGNSRNNRRNNKKLPRKPSRISDDPMSSHTYAEIADDVDESFGKNRERQPSASTIDNPYVGLPRKSADGRPRSPRATSPGDVYLKVPGGSACGVNVDERSVYYNNPNVNVGRYPEDRSAYAVPLTSLR